MGRIVDSVPNCAVMSVTYGGGRRRSGRSRRASRGAKLFFTSKAVGETPAALAAGRSELIPSVQCVFSVGDDVLPGAQPLASALAPMPPAPVPDQIAGFYILYSSGTTGRCHCRLSSGKLPKHQLRKFYATTI